MISVFLTDENMDWKTSKQYFLEVHKWAEKNCASYQGHNIQDVMDFSLVYDYIAHYQFSDERDVVMFKLRWS